MPTTIATPGENAVDVRFKEPYVSKGLNKKLFGLIGAGVVRGGKLVTTGFGFGVNIVPDVDEGDSVYSYQDVNSLQLSVRQPGTVALNLAAAAGSTVYVALYVGYTTSGSTVCEWRTYSQAELFGGSPVAEAAFVIILGKIVVPGSGPIPAANITPTKRRMAWVDRMPDGWHQIVKNGNFEQGLAAGATGFYGFQHWLATPTGTPNMLVSTTAPYDGTREFQLQQPSPSVVNNRVLFQEVVVPVKPGQHVRGRVRLRGAAWGPIDAGGHQGLNVAWLTEDFSTVSSSWIENIALSGTFGYTLIDDTVEVPATAAWARVSVGINNNGASLPAGSLFFDDVKVWVESVSPISEVFEQNKLSDSFVTEAVSFEPSFFDAPSSMSDFIARTVRFAKGAAGGTPSLDTLIGLMRGGDPFRLFLAAGQFRSDLWTNAQYQFARFVGTWVSSGTVAATYTLMMQFGSGNAAVNRIRFYARHGQYSGGLEGGDLNITLNCGWDGTNWVKDDSSRLAYRIRLSAAADVTGRLSGLSFFYAPIGFSTFTDTQWFSSMNFGKPGDALEDAAIKFIPPTGYLPAFLQAMSGDVLGQPDFHVHQRMSDGAIIISHNAENDPATDLWNYDAGTGASRIVITREAVSIDRFTTTGPTWAESAWVPAGKFGFDATAKAYLFLHDEALATAVGPSGPNQFTSRGLPKAWGACNVTSGTASLIGGWNITSASRLTGPSRIRFTLTEGYDTALLKGPGIVTGLQGAGAGLPYYSSVYDSTGSTVDVEVYDASGSPVDLSSIDVTSVNFVLFGVQS